MAEAEIATAAEDLAKRLRLLLDVAEAETGIEPTFTQIAAFLDARGTNLSRSRWTYIVNGHRYVQDATLFEGLAAFFDVDPAFLAASDGAETPAKVSAQLDLVRSMRAARVKSYAARTLGDISPDALRAISRFLDAEVAQRPPDGSPHASGGN
jgi:transcriptional regulator with XRE-family HTH domain